MSAYELVVDALRANGSHVIERGTAKAQAQCPAHDDRNPSLEVKPRSDGKGVTVHCYAGCDYRDVLAAAGLTIGDLFDEPRLRDAYGDRRTYRYPDGREVHRKPGKRFHQSGNTKGRALFHAERIGDAALVYVPEGEKDVEAIEAVGGTAVCPPQGAATPPDRFDWTVLAGLTVIVVADRDDNGRKHARAVVKTLDGIALRVEVFEAAVGKDVADHIAAGLALHELVRVELDEAGPGAGEPTTNATEHGDPAETPFFDRNGLRALDLANAVMRSVTCGFSDIDERFYVHDGGVWVPNAGRIEAEIARLLGNRYRSAHGRNALDLIRFSPHTARITRDPHPRYINVPNGMVDWAAGKLLPHSPRHLSTVQLPVEYHPDATCPTFERFLADVLPPDCCQPRGDSPGFIWELLGYAIYSGNPLHVAVLLYGKGRNGKGTLIRVLKRLLGERNCSTVTLHELAENRFRAATLFGKLANLAGDLDSRWLESTAMFKAITGGDTIQGEHKYGAAFDFQPWALPFYSTNNAFGSADSSEGWVARWVVVPFPVSFIGREDRGLDARLQTDAELRGILRRGIDALPALMNRGRLPEPQSVRDAKATFVSASDAVRSWLKDQCTIRPDAWTPRTDLYAAYTRHVGADGGKRLAAHHFYNRIEQVNGIDAATRRGTRGFKGIRLARPSDADEGAWGAQGAGSPLPPTCARTGERVEEGAPCAPHAPDGADPDPNGLCRDCGANPHSPGRTRCDECHRIHTRIMAGYDQ